MCGHRVRLKYSVAIALHTLQANIYKILANRIFCAFCDLGDLGNLVHFQTNKYTVIKNKTRIIEKKINKIDKKILAIEKDLHETQLDYFYVSSPGYLSKKIQQLAFIEYMPMDFSRIYLNYRDFTDDQKKITILKMNNEEKKKKK